MNIFITNKCPVESARFLDDKRVVKMCLETAQMLCTAINEGGGPSPYKTTHKNHPCNIWARESAANWAWLWYHGMALCDEYTARYDKVHKCQSIIENLLPTYENFLPRGDLTEFPNCAANKELGINYKHLKDVFLAYQLYLNDRWDNDKKTPTWYGVGR